jgi:hypothetical protein
MKKIICFAILFLNYTFIFSQTPLPKEKQIKEIKPIADTSLAYPLKGVIRTRVIYGVLNMTEVEYTVYDANGGKIYSGAENYLPGREITLDPEYVRYMTLQGNYYMLRKGYINYEDNNHYASKRSY